MPVRSMIGEGLVRQNKPSLLKLGVESSLTLADAPFGEHAMSYRSLYCAGHSKRQYREVSKDVQYN